MSSDEEMVIVTKKKYKINSILSDESEQSSEDSDSPVKNVAYGIDESVSKTREQNENIDMKLCSSSESNNDCEQDNINSPFNNDTFKRNYSGNSLKTSHNSEDDLTEDDLNSPVENQTSILPKESGSNNKAENAVEEIHKQSQRMLREASVSIPYHRPRQHTLMEFRERKKATPTVSLHTSADQLVTVWKAIEQREKEAEEFYKSDVSSDETEDEETKLYGNTVQETPVFVADNGKNTSLTTKHQQSFISDAQVSSDIFNAKNDEEYDLSKLDNCVNEPIISTSNENISRKCICTEASMIINSEQKNTVANVNKIESGCTGQCLKRCLFFNDQNLKTGERIEITDKILQSNYNEKLIENEDSPKMPEVSDPNNLSNTEDYSLKLSESQSESLKHDDENLSNKIHAEFGIKTQIIKNICDNITHDNSIHGFIHTSKDTYDKTPSQNIYSDSEFQDSNEDAKFVQCDIKHLHENIDQQTNYRNSDESAPLKMVCEEHKTVVNNSILNKNNVPGEECTAEYKSNTQCSYLRNSIANHPKINGSCENIIDLDDGLPRSGVSSLIERFYTHLSYKKKPVKKKTPLELRVISAETDASGHVNAVDEEILKVVVGNEEEENDPALTKPGAKFARLKAQLQAEMGKQREVEWFKKHQEQRLYEEEIFEEEENICDDDNKENEKKEDKERDENQSEEENDEDEIDDDEIESDELEERDHKKRNVFLDDEAEDSEDNDCFGKDIDADNTSDILIKRPLQNKIVLKRTRTADMFSSQETLKYQNDDEELTSFQKPLAPDAKVEEVEESESAVCSSPAIRLTALEGKEVTDSYNWSEPTTPCKELVSPKTVTPVRTIAQLVDKSPLVGSQDLENLCSGQFVSQPIQVNEDNNTQDFQLFLAEGSQISQVQITPLKTVPVTLKDTAEKKEPISLLEDDDAIAASVVSKKVKKLNFSDDEDTSQTMYEEEGETSDEEGKPEDEHTTEDVAYDSEENEVVKTVGEFLDKEAELSESEWSSEDEDEYGLDTLEMEEADREKINQRKLKQQLDQIHMKQMLIEDKKEVRLLQEMLLEDGELHSEGRRQRLFRWSNDIAGTENKQTLFDSDEDKAEEDEDEENWRRTRHEREQYLKEHSKKLEKLELIIEEESETQLLKLGQNAIKRLNSNSQEPKLPSTTNTSVSPGKEKSHPVMMKRGSFLSRGQQVLSRLAQMVASNSDAPLNQPKNSRNFVFASVSPSKDEGKAAETVQQANKRKLPMLPLPMAKKPCVKKPMTANRKSLFEELFKVQR